MDDKTPARRPASMAQVRRACAYLEHHADAPVTLARLAAHVQASPFQLHRSFTRLVGITPRAYQDALRAGQFRRRLRAGAAVVGATYESGYGSSSRVYERQPTGRGMTPAVYRKGGKGTAIAYTVASSPMGRLLVAGTTLGVCAVKLGDRDDRLEQDLRQEYPAATITRDDATLAEWVEAILAQLDGSLPHLDLPLDVQATAFQWKVWRYLQTIPRGETRTYSEVARQIGAPAAVRAVASACAANPVCLVVPCHRVVRKGGALGGYRWGLDRKRKLLADEAQ